MSNIEQQTQILYELAMDIGGTLDIRLLLKRVVQSFLRKLNCIGGAVIAVRENNQEMMSEEMIVMPKNIKRNESYQAIVGKIKTGIGTFSGNILWRGAGNRQGIDLIFYSFDLPEYGYLLLFKSTPFEETFIYALKPVCEKFAEACIACENNQALALSRENLRITLNSIGDAVIVTDKEGRITRMNPNAEKLTGWSLSEARENNFKTVFNIVHAKTREPVLNPVEKILETGEIVGLANHTLLIARNGHEYQISDSGAPIKDNLGNVVGVVLVFRDVTEEYNLREILIKEKNHAEMIIRNSTNLICGVDDNGTTTFINPATERVTGYSNKELVGNNLWKILYPDDCYDQVLSLLNKLSKEGEILDFDMILISKSKKKKHVLWSSYTRRDGSENINEIILFGTDITSRKQAEEALIMEKERAEESDRLKSAFLANMSHEIRTPMNGILGFADLLREPELSENKLHKYLDIIVKSGNRMLGIINDLVDISKIESGQVSVCLSDINLNHQTEYLYNFFKPEAEKKGIKLCLINQLPHTEAFIRTDKDKLLAILVNLIKNALKYTKHGSIELGYIKDDNTLKFFVSDTGIGIPESRMEAIFDRFVQADIEDTMAMEGAGLGLAISKAYVEMLGGKIWVQSKENAGTKFYFTIPCNSFNSNSEQQIDKTPNGSDILQVKIKKVLFVDDDEVSIIYLKEIFKTITNEVFITHDGQKAIEIIRNNPDIDLVLMDIKMPVLSGYEAAREIRKFNKGVIIIAQTAFALSGDREKALNAGCNDYVAKPVNREQLKNILQRYFS